jgi:serine/threonine-protein kinase RsbW
MTARQREAVGDVTRLRVANGPLTAPVLCRVVSMVLTRANWPVDRLDDALLVCDALCAHAPAHAGDGHLTFDVQANELQAELRVGELTHDGAKGLFDDASLPGVGNVLEQLTERISIEADDHRTDSQLIVMLRGHSQDAD